ncbi:hypothetical protein IH575_02420 [Candidatus Dojkabacteria bacterium]|nr:hypothetical protein [Candidatus Dojkabacteria bacterium]
MERFRFYIVIFAITFILAIVFSLADAGWIVDLVSFLAFLASIIYFLFSFEEPPKAKKLLIPEVHNYYKSRMNNYTNLVAIEFALLSFVFFIIIATTSISWALTILSLWFISIPITYVIILQTSKNLEKEKLVNYFSLKFPEYEFVLLEQIVTALLLSESLKRYLLLQNLQDKTDNESLPLEKFVDTYLEYLKAAGISLVSGEIEEINKL